MKNGLKHELEKQGIFSIREVYYAAYDGKELQLFNSKSLNHKEKNVTNLVTFFYNE